MPIADHAYYRLKTGYKLRGLLNFLNITFLFLTYKCAGTCAALTDSAM